MNFPKDEYTTLQRKLTVAYRNTDGNYNVIGGISDWLELHDIAPTRATLNIIYAIYGTAPYVYELDARLEILQHLATYNHKGVAI